MYYISHKDLNIEGKNFVDLARTSRRDEFSLNTCDVRIRNVKSAIPRAKSAQRKKVEAIDDLLNETNADIIVKQAKTDAIAEKKIYRLSINHTL